MTNNDNLATVLSAIANADRTSSASIKTPCTSTVVRAVLDVLAQASYIDGYEVTPDGKAGTLTIKLKRAINKVGAVKPRFAVTARGFTKFEKRYLPAQGFGILVVSTPRGIMTHEEAKQAKTGGRLLAYCY